MARPLRESSTTAPSIMSPPGETTQSDFQGQRRPRTVSCTLARVTERFHWICHAYCLMNNHYHLVIETPDGNLSKGMRQLNGVYTQAFNKRHGRVGHIFQGRFKGFSFRKTATFWRSAVMWCSTRSEQRRSAVRGSGNGAVTARRRDGSRLSGCIKVDEILSHFGQRKAVAQEKYCEFIQAGIGSPSIWESFEAQSFLGVEGFAEGLRRLCDRKTRSPRDTEGSTICRAAKLEETVFRSGAAAKHRGTHSLRKHKDYGYSQMEVASFLDLHYSTNQSR